MLILDTNVVSEAMKPDRNPTVRDWLNRQAIPTLHVTAINVAELRGGVAVVKDSRRRQDLAARMDRTLAALIHDRVLPLDGVAAERYAVGLDAARAAGHAVSVMDGMIAGIALVHGYPVATRDTSPFLAMGCDVINPWESDP